MKLLAEALRTKAQKRRKFGVVMREFYHGGLHSGGSGTIVTSPKQAQAIAASEAGMPRRKAK